MRHVASILIALLLAPAVASAMPLDAPEPERAPAPEPVDVGILLAGLDAADVDAALRLADARVTWSLPGAPFLLAQTARPGALDAALGTARVVRDSWGAGAGGWTGTLDDPLASGQWALPALRAQQAWALEGGTTAVKVAVVDSGLDFDHPDFAGVSIEKGLDFVGNDLEPEDAHGHGTHVAGIIAAARGNGVGIAGMADVTILVLRVLDAQNRGSCLEFAAAVVEATVRGAHVINLSLYCSSGDPVMQQAVRFATQRGALVVAAGGNFQNHNPNNIVCPTYPARWDDTLAVAALEPSLAVAAYSCVGAAIDIAAPGSRVLSTVVGGYDEYWGTSMATPHTAAAAALVKSKEPSMTMADVRARLESTARDLGPSGRDVWFGRGMVEPLLALQ